MDCSNAFPVGKCTLFGVKDQRSADELPVVRRFAATTREELLRRVGKEPRRISTSPGKLEFEYPVTIPCTNLKNASTQGRMLLNIRCHGGAHQENFDMAQAGGFVADRELPAIDRVEYGVEVSDNSIEIFAIEHFFKPRHADLKSIDPEFPVDC